MFSKTFLVQTLPPKPSKLFLYKMGCLSSDDQCKWVGELILVFRLLYVCDPTQHEVVKSLKVCIFISKRNFPQNKNVVKLYIYPPYTWRSDNIACAIPFISKEDQEKVGNDLHLWPCNVKVVYMKVKA